MTFFDRLFDRLFERDDGETYAELDALHEEALERDRLHEKTQNEQE